MGIQQYPLEKVDLSPVTTSLGTSTDAANPTGSLHSKVRLLKVLDFLTMLNDGSDGAFSPTANTQLESGIYRFSSVSIPVGVTITPSGSFLVILCTGDVTINGLLSASGKGAAGGASLYADEIGKNGLVGATGNLICGSGGGGGGAFAFDTGVTGGAGGSTTDYASGSAGSSSSAGGSGFGATKLGRFPTDLRTLLSAYGGGGGGGGVVDRSSPGYAYGGAGGAGGGCLFLFTLKQITGSGAVRADGISGGNATGYSGTGIKSAGGGGGGGGGGLVYAIASSITLATLTASSGIGGAGFKSDSAATDVRAYSGGNGGPGVVLRVVI